MNLEGVYPTEGIGTIITLDSPVAEATEHEDTDSVRSISQYRGQIPEASSNRHWPSEEDVISEGPIVDIPVSQQVSSNSTGEQPADSRQSWDSAVLVGNDDSDTDNEDNDNNQTNEVPVTSDERVSGQTETHQTSSDDNSNDEKDSDKR